MIPAEYVAPEHVCPIGVYPSQDGRRAVWSVPIRTDIGDLILPHLLRASGDDGPYFRYGVVKTPSGHGVVYSGPQPLPQPVLDEVLPEMVRVALEEASLFLELYRANPHR